MGVLIVLWYCSEDSIAIEVTSTSDAPSDSATFITDVSTGVSVVPSSANVTILVPGGGAQTSAATARGKFDNGITTPGTGLPPENQIPAWATYDGGLGIDEGICMSTGWVTNFAVPQTGRGFGVEGPNNGDQDGGLPANHEGEASRRLGLERDQDLLEAAFPT